MSAPLLEPFNGPAPAYAIESDSEDDQWDDDPAQPPLAIKKGKNEQNNKNNPTKILEWQPKGPEIKFDSQSTLLVLLGDAGLLVASGLPEEFISKSEPFNQLDQYLLVSDSAKLTLSPAYVPLELQTPLAQKLLTDLQPPSLTIISSYSAPTYIPPSSDQPPIRYLASIQSSNHDLPLIMEKLGCHHFQVPNLIKGFEAALMIQATMLKIETKIILLPAISRPHDQKSSASIPIGQYDFSTGLSEHHLPPSLLSIEDSNFQTTIKNLIDHFFALNLVHPIKWVFPIQIHPLFDHVLRSKLNLDLQFRPKETLHHHSNNHVNDVSLMYL